MSRTSRHDVWQAGDSYDRYMGRWSSLVAPRFLDWLAAPRDADWLEVGCGTGALSATILARGEPRSLVAVDPSEGFVAGARSGLPDARAVFRTGDAQALPLETASVDVVVSGLVLNFVPDKARALAEMQRVARSGGMVGFYVWDYPGGGIAFMRAFWEAATALDPGARDLAEGVRFPFCTADSLAEMTRRAGLSAVACMPIAVSTAFADFDDFWQPFTLGVGPAPGYCMSLDPEARRRLQEKLAADVPRGMDGSIVFEARAWAVKAVRV